MKFGIIAGGQGSRLQEEGILVAKPLVEMEGKPMIGRLIDIFMECGADSIAVVINRDMPEVIDYVNSLPQDEACPLLVKRVSTPSSMHTLYELSELVFPEMVISSLKSSSCHCEAEKIEEKDGIIKGNEEKLIVTTVDTIFRRGDFKEYVEAFRKSDKVDALMAVTKYIEDEKPLYVKTDDRMNIVAFLDVKEDGVNFVSGGIYGLTKRCMPVLQKSISEGVHKMRNYQRALISEGLSVKAFDMGKIIDVDHVSDIAVARSFLDSPGDSHK